MTALVKPDIDDFSRLSRTPASDVKKLGWRGLMRTLQAEGRLLVTNHNEPEAVILSLQEYAAFARMAQQNEAAAEIALQTLRQRFDERLAVLQAPDAGRRLQAVMRKPAKLGGKAKAGAAF